MEKTGALNLRGIFTVLAGIVLILWTGQGLGQTGKPTTHTIFMTALEGKGGTTTDKLAPPHLNPGDLSKGYDFKRPGEADKNNPNRWEVSSYRLDPGFVTIHQGDTVKLIVFIVNGDKHDVRITDPDGREAVPVAIWNRGREYQLSFVAKKTGAYQLTCSQHAPTMTATFLILPRK